METVAVVGAGPKGIALAAKARALADLGFDAPRVVLVDHAGIAESWSGRRGYTNGLLPLGTPPEKDIGFPYADSWRGASAEVSDAMTRLSWQRHLVERGQYADWVDRGRLRPSHRRWSAYLRAVAQKAEADVIEADVVGLEFEGWESDELVRRTIAIPRQLAERLAAEAESRDLGINDLIIELAEQGLPKPVADD